MLHTEDRTGAEPHFSPQEFLLKVKERLSLTLCDYEEVEAELKKPLVKKNGHLMRGAYYLDKIADDVLPRQRVRVEELNRDILKIEKYLQKHAPEVFGQLSLRDLQEMDYDTYVGSVEGVPEDADSPIREMYTAAHNAARALHTGE